MKRIMQVFPLFIAVMFLCSCGKTVEISDEKSSVEISDYEEVSFTIQFCNPSAVTYTVSSTKENFLFYEEHQFAYVQTYINDGWYSLVDQPVNSTGDFRGAAISTAEITETISINTLYGGELEKGTYRLVAPCYTSEKELFALENPVYIAAKFEIE